MIRIITDSTSDITPEEAKKLSIDIVPLYVIIGSKNYKDRVDIDTREFYEKLKESPITTSQPSPADFLEVYHKYPNDEIICITCTHKLSGTYQSAVVAAESFENSKIKVIESTSISLGLRNTVMEAVRMRDEGFDCDAIVEHIEAINQKSFIVGSLETLEYLKRGGRISNVSAALGTLLNVKPILKVSDGVIETYDKKVRGKKNALKFIANQLSDMEIDTSLPISVGYTNEIENSKMLIDTLKTIDISIDESTNFAEIGPVIGTHVGPGCYLLAFFLK